MIVTRLNIFWRIPREERAYYRQSCSLCRTRHRYRSATWEQATEVDRFGIVLHMRCVCGWCKRKLERNLDLHQTNAALPMTFAGPFPPAGSRGRSALGE